jgi:hypothetical protein
MRGWILYTEEILNANFILDTVNRFGDQHNNFLVIYDIFTATCFG